MSLRRGWADLSDCLSNIHAFFSCPNVINAVCPKDKLHFPASFADWTNQWHERESCWMGSFRKRASLCFAPFFSLEMASWELRWPGGSHVIGMMGPWWPWNSHTSLELLPSRHCYKCGGGGSLSWLNVCCLGFLLYTVASKFDQDWALKDFDKY